MESGGFDSDSEVIPVVRWSVARMLGALIGAGALGMAIALAFWLSCYHQSDITKFWGQIAMVMLGVVAIGVLLVSRPTLALAAVMLPAVAVAVWGYWWLVGNTGATRCSWYRPEDRGTSSPTSGAANTTWTGPTTGQPPPVITTRPAMPVPP